MALKGTASGFVALHAFQHAQTHGLPDKHLFRQHYDLLQRLGCRMDDFIRGDE